MGTLFTGLGAAAALSVTDIIPVHQGGARAVGLTGAQLLTYVGGSYVAKTGAQSMAGPLTIASGTLTASAPALSITQTWTTGAAFTAALMNITDTSSTSTSKFLDFQVAGSSKFSVEKTGTVRAPVGAIIGYSLGAHINGAVYWHDPADLILWRDAAATLAQRNGATAQTLRIYGTADGSPGANYQRLVLSANGTTGVTIAAEGLGMPGANQDITLMPGGTGTVKTSVFAAQVLYAGIPGVTVPVVLSYNGNIGLSMGDTSRVSWSSNSEGQTAADSALMRNAAGIVEVTNGTANIYRDLKLRNLLNTEYHEMTEMTAPAAGAANTARIFAVDNGSGKTKLMVQFATGAAQQLAIEP